MAFRGALTVALALILALVVLPVAEDPGERGARAQGGQADPYDDLFSPDDSARSPARPPAQSSPFRQGAPAQPAPGSATSGALSSPAGSGSGQPPTVDDYRRLAASGGSSFAASAPEQAGMVSSLAAFEVSLGIFRARLLGIIDRVPDAVAEISSTLRAASPTGRPLHFLGIAVFTALLLMMGRAVGELYYAYLARPIFVRLQKPDPQGYGDKLPVLVVRLVLTVIGVAIVVSVAQVVGLAFYSGHKPTLITVIVVFAAYASIQIAHTFWRVVLAPFLPAYRLPVIDDRQARGLYRWITAASVISLIAAAFSYWVEALGLPREVSVVVTAGSTLLSVIALALALSMNRRTISTILLGGQAPVQADGLPARLTALQQIVVLGWWPLTVVYLLGSWGDLFFRLVMGIEAGAERIIAPFTVLVSMMLIYALVVFASDRIFARRRRIRALNAAADRAAAAEAARDAASDAARAVGRDAAAAGRGAIGTGIPGIDGAVPPDVAAVGDVDRLSRTDGPETSGASGDGGGEDEGPSGGPPSAVERRAMGAPIGGMRTFEDLARRVATILALGSGAWLAVWYWGGAGMFADSAFFGIVEDVVDIAFIGYVVFHATRIWLDQKIAEESGDPEEQTAVLEGEGGGAGASRTATLLPLVRNFILSVIAVSAVLLIAIEMGVNVAPLFAGAGVVGLAIGFGAQTLVRDIISGAFFLLDDAFRKGEYIDVGSVKGTVEKISIRSFQLRHHLGMLHTIPFGEIQYLTNFSRDWVMMKLPLRLTYDTDIERVRKLIKKLGQRLMDDPTVGHLFLQPLKSQGVIQMEDSAMIVRVKFMTRPGDQWVTRKRVFAEIRQLFEKEGIKFAHREVTVRIPGQLEAPPLTSQQTEAVGAAARANLDVIEAEAMRRTGTGGPMDDR
ncbi:MAG: mechanosensitive ion channel domain-containing protein [Pseudomonadota bacterium]